MCGIQTQTQTRDGNERKTLVRSYLTTNFRYPGAMMAILGKSIHMYDGNSTRRFGGFLCQRLEGGSTSWNRSPTLPTSKKLKQLFDFSQKQILNPKNEIFGRSTIEWTTTPWMRTTLLHDRVLKSSETKLHVHSDSVLCLGTIQRHPQSTEAFEAED